MIRSRFIFLLDEKGRSIRTVGLQGLFTPDDADMKMLVDLAKECKTEREFKDFIKSEVFTRCECSKSDDNFSYINIIERNFADEYSLVWFDDVIYIVNMQAFDVETKDIDNQPLSLRKHTVTILKNGRPFEVIE